jgi:ubiquinone/menaquinone biosynthesis C-methylase UbiE
MKVCLRNIICCEVMNLKSSTSNLKGNQMIFYDARYAVLDRAVNKLSNAAMLLYDNRLIKLALQKFGKEKANLVLDVGAGQGTDAILLSKRALDVVAIDISFKALATAKSLFRNRKDNSNVSLVQADAEHLPFREGVFDVVFCKDVLHHVSNSVRSVKEMKRVGNEKACLVAVEANALNPQMIAIGMIYYSIDHGVFRNTSSRLMDIFSEAGVKNVQITATEFLPRHVLFEYRSPLTKFSGSSSSVMLKLLAIAESAWENHKFLSKFSNYIIVSGFKKGR